MIARRVIRRCRLLRRRLAAAVVLLGIVAAPARSEAGFNEWTTRGPSGESILSVAVNRLTPSIVYAGSNGAGVFRSFDGGLTWAAASDGLANLIVAALAIDPREPATVFAGTSGGGVFRSLDGGTSWTAVNNGLTNGVVTAIELNPAVPTTLYAATTGGGVFRSLDGGATWTAVNSGLTNTAVSALAVDPVTPSIVYAAAPGQGGVFRSANAGATWVAVNSGLTNTVVSWLAVDPVTPATLYAATTGGGIFKSSTAGAVWAPVNRGLDNLVVTRIAIDPIRPATVYAGTVGGGVFRSVTAGTRWASLNDGLDNLTVTALAVTAGGACVHAGTRGSGVFDFALVPDGCTPPPVSAAVLPSSRSVQVGTAATAFATIVNSSALTAINCGIDLLSVLPATFAFQTTDPNTNQVTGTPGTPVNIAAGERQTYVIAVTPHAPFPSTDVRFEFGCDNTAAAPIIVGVDTLLLTASPTPVPDIVAVAAADGGIVDIPGRTGTGLFGVATTNMGVSGSITATADTGAAPVPVSLAVCEIDQVSAACKESPAASVTRTIGPGETPSFAVFVTGRLDVVFAPAVNRVFVRFRDALGVTRGSTSVAVRTQ